MSRCTLCDATASRKQSVFCSGPCKNVYHLECVNIPGELLSHLASVPGLQWRCNVCRTVEQKVDERKYLDAFEKYCTQLFSDFQTQFVELKQQIIKSASEKFAEIVPTQTPVKSYAQITSQKKIIVKPKNAEQNNSRTKADLLNTVNPLDKDVKINSVKHIKDGGILVGCDHLDSASIILNAAEEKLSDNYEIRIAKSILPQLRVVGMSEKLDVDTFKNYLMKQNNELFRSDSECNILDISCTKKKNNVFQAVLQVDVFSYQNIMSRGNVIIGYDWCSVYEAINVPRCFKCNGFFHSHKHCKSDLTCPLCSGSHDVKNCSSDVRQCCNCISMKKSRNVDIPTDHAAWDYANCFSYKKYLDKLKFDLLGSSRQ